MGTSFDRLDHLFENSMKHHAVVSSTIQVISRIVSYVKQFVEINFQKLIKKRFVYFEIKETKLFAMEADTYALL